LGGGGHGSGTNKEEVKRDEILGKRF